MTSPATSPVKLPVRSPVKLPVTFTSPTTCNLLAGLSIPIPTFPSELITILSISFVFINNLLSFVALIRVVPAVFFTPPNEPHAPFPYPSNSLLSVL